jgi:hypothetical protein
MEEVLKSLLLVNRKITAAYFIMALQGFPEHYLQPILNRSIFSNEPPMDNAEKTQIINYLRCLNPNCHSMSKSLRNKNIYFLSLKRILYTGYSADQIRINFPKILGDMLRAYDHVYNSGIQNATLLFGPTWERYAASPEDVDYDLETPPVRCEYEHYSY